MSLTIANNITNTDTYIGDTSTDRISQAERFQALTEATVWLLEELGNDHAVKTYTLNYLDTVHYYKVTTAVADLLASADLRRAVQNQTISASHKSARELSEDIGQQSSEFAWAVERRDGDSYIVVNLFDSKSKAMTVDSFDRVGDWVVDSSTSDATNLTVDLIEFQEGSGSLNFDVDVSQSGNNKATIYNDDLDLDLTAYIDLGSWLLEVYIPENLYVSSYTLTWGSDSSNYWSTTVTTDYNGSALADGWNKLKFNWADSTATGSPDVDDITYIAITVNYTGSQTDDTDFRVDYLRIANPEKLTYHYVSWHVGTDSSGTDITAFSATTDIPFYSGQYDQYKYPVAHKAASILLFALRLREEALVEEREAITSLRRLKDLFPSSQVAETKNFKVKGINFRMGRGRRSLRGWGG